MSLSATAWRRLVEIVGPANVQHSPEERIAYSYDATPMLARLPSRFKAGARCDSPVSLVDVAATVLSAAARCRDCDSFMYMAQETPPTGRCTDPPGAISRNAVPNLC